MSVTSTTVYYLPARLEPTLVKPLARIHSKGKLLALPTYARLGTKMANTLAYCNTGLIAAVKRCIVEALVVKGSGKLRQNKLACFDLI